MRTNEDANAVRSNITLVEAHGPSGIWPVLCEAEKLLAVREAQEASCGNPGDAAPGTSAGGRRW